MPPVVKRQMNPKMTQVTSEMNQAAVAMRGRTSRHRCYQKMAMMAAVTMTMMSDMLVQKPHLNQVT